MKMSETMRGAMQAMRGEGGRIGRFPGGFWATIGTQTRLSLSGIVPEWWVGVATIRAMEKRGWVRRCNVHREEWRDERELTEAGILALEAALERTAK